MTAERVQWVILPLFKLFSFILACTLLVILVFTPLPNSVGDYRGLLSAFFDVTHFIGFFWVGYKWVKAFSFRIVISLMAGMILIELLQYFTGRTASWIDLLLGMTGLLAGIRLGTKWRFLKVLAWNILFAYLIWAFARALWPVNTGYVANFDGFAELVSVNQLGSDDFGQLMKKQHRDRRRDAYLRIEEYDYPWIGVRFDYLIPYEMASVKDFQFDLSAHHSIDRIVIKLENSDAKQQFELAVNNNDWKTYSLDLEQSIDDKLKRITSVSIFAVNTGRRDAYFEIDNIKFTEL